MANEHLGLDNPVFAGRLKHHEPSRAVAQVPRRQYSTNRSTSFDLSVSLPKPLVVIAKPAEPAEQEPFKTVAPTEPRSFEPPANLKPSKHRRGTKLSLALTSLAVILFASGLTINLSVLKNTHQAQAQVAALSSNGSSADPSVPSEDKPANLKDYKVGPTMPRFIRISKLSVEARVKSIGVKPSGQLQAPSNVFDTGWYDGSSKPGEAGAALIDAHVSGPTKHGSFYDLKKLVVGDVIQIERGDGKLLNFKVASSKSYPSGDVDMASTLVSADTSKPGLNLMTCDGQFDSKTGEYKNRLVVYAVRQ